ncbi:hypothetical protein [Enterovibrio sp. 27052020O]|uniref:hypothetical protein n=1 Tax=Enterovibrio sp. 27052020O TaxID=3241166 RepID=UPI00388FA2AD
MRNITLRKSGILGVLLALMLVIFSTPSFSMAGNADISLQTTHSVSVDIDSSQHDDAPTSLHTEKRSPAKSLAPNLGQLLRIGSWLPERINNLEPNYELVIDLSLAIPHAFHPHFHVALTHWQDWTRGSPNTPYRVAGWKDSNLLYRFISQSHA